MWFITFIILNKNGRINSTSHLHDVHPGISHNHVSTRKINSPWITIYSLCQWSIWTWVQRNGKKNTVFTLFPLILNPYVSLYFDVSNMTKFMTQIRSPHIISKIQLEFLKNISIYMTWHKLEWHIWIVQEMGIALITINYIYYLKYPSPYINLNYNMDYHPYAY